MKKKFLVLLCALLLTACGAKSVVDKETAAKLSEDIFTMDFYLDDVKYTLPDATLQDFIQNGWKASDDLNGISLKSKFYYEVELEKEDTKLVLCVVNNEENEVPVQDVHVNTLKASYSSDKKPLSMVAKGGITLQSSNNDAKAIIKELNLKNPDMEADSVYNENGLMDETMNGIILEFTDNDGVINSIKVGNDYNIDLEYLAYESEKDEAENIERRKASIEENSKAKVEGHYDQIVKNGTTPLDIHMTFKVVDEGEVTSTYFDKVDIAAGRVYILKGSDGNSYALNVEDVSDLAYIQWNDLAIGDEIEVWGTIYELLGTEEENVKIPSIDARMIEKNGAMIYRAR